MYGSHVATVAAAETTTSTTYTDLSGPSITVTVDTAGVYRVVFGAHMRRTAGTGTQIMSLDISGATTNGPGSSAGMSSATAGTPPISIGTTTLVFRTMVAYAYLNAGTNTIKCQYSAASGTTAEFSNRFLQVQRVT